MSKSGLFAHFGSKEDLQMAREGGLLEQALAARSDEAQIVFELAGFMNQVNNDGQLWSKPETFVRARRSICRALPEGAHSERPRDA